MFHAHDGWFFQRNAEDGSVIVLRGEDFGVAEEVGRFDVNTWASIIASVCSVGENGQTFDRAKALHVHGQ